jgi:hypothetical protein
LVGCCGDGHHHRAGCRLWRRGRAVAVNALEILQEFEDNELAADSKYKGKTVKITGVVNEIDTEFFDEDKYILRLGVGGEFES